MYTEGAPRTFVGIIPKMQGPKYPQHSKFFWFANFNDLCGESICMGVLGIGAQELKILEDHSNDVDSNFFKNVLLVTYGDTP